MSSIRILSSNVGYTRGLSGSFSDQVLRAYRHVYTRRSVRSAAVAEIRGLVEATRPHVVGLLEVDRKLASGTTPDRLLSALAQTHPHGDVANKYFAGHGGRLVPVLGRNCNAFCSTNPLPFERVYLASGMKRLVHKISLTPRLTLFLAHFSLRRAVRRRQFADLRGLVDATPGDHVVMGDFNVFTGFDELDPLLSGSSSLVLLNHHATTTHRFHRTHRVLDLCLCSRRLRSRTVLDVIDQPFSDHSALLLRIDGVKTHARPVPPGLSEDGRPR